MTRGLAKMTCVVGSVGATVVLATRIRSGHVATVDERITRRVQEIDARGFSWVMYAVSWPGFPPQNRIAPWVIPAMLLGVGRPLEALFQLLAWGTGALSWLLKQIMKRPRPGTEVFNVVPAGIDGSSFPSAHVMIYTGVFGFFIYVCRIFIPVRWVRSLMSGGLLAMIALVGPSRIYLGHHWASDVIASYLLGTSYLVVLTSLYQRVRSTRLT